jgi:hypothetical protein
MFEKPTKVDMSVAKLRLALLAKKSSVGLESVFVSMEKEEDGSLLAKSSRNLNMVFKFRDVRMDEVERNNSIDLGVKGQYKAWQICFICFHVSICKLYLLLYYFTNYITIQIHYCELIGFFLEHENE